MKLIVRDSLRCYLQIATTCVVASLYVAAVPAYAIGDSRPSNASPSDEASDSMVIGAQVSGEVKEIFISVGDKVSRGDLIATIKPSNPIPKSALLNSEGLAEVRSPIDATVIHCFVIPGQMIEAGLGSRLFEFVLRRAR